MLWTRRDRNVVVAFCYSLPLFFSVRSFCFVSFEKNNNIFFAITRLPSHSRLHRELQSNRTTIAVLISSVWQSDSRSMVGHRNRIEFVSMGLLPYFSLRAVFNFIFPLVSDERTALNALIKFDRRATVGRAMHS